MAPAFARLDFTARIYDNPVPGQGPVLLATRIEDAKLPTVLGYGHGDVIRGLEDQWTKGKGPWVTARDGDRLYGRGTADNKGQHTINMAALEAVREERGGRLGFNAKFIVEMGEEAGSKGLAELVAAHKADFAADVLVASAPSISISFVTCARAAITPATGEASSPTRASSWRMRSLPSSVPRVSCWSPPSRRRP
jgi:acetylornithine deacetylase/succinyl-diaminopimelate desuccinylase-like protein